MDGYPPGFPDSASFPAAFLRGAPGGLKKPIVGIHATNQDDHRFRGARGRTSRDAAAEAIWNVLMSTSRAHTWDEEVYFSTPVKVRLKYDARDACALSGPYFKKIFSQDAKSEGVSIPS